MHTGQTMLVIVALSLLTIMTLAINSTMIVTSSYGLEMESSLNALSVAQSMLDEISQRDFDEVTTGNHRVYTYAAMSDVLGPEPGEKNWVGSDTLSETHPALSKSRFDDVDDYNRYRRLQWNPRLGYDTVVVLVTYANELDPSQDSPTKTWQKRIRVFVGNFTMPKDVNGHPLPYSIQDLAIYRKYY